jgi:hypothetical protein
MLFETDCGEKDTHCHTILSLILARECANESK